MNFLSSVTSARHDHPGQRVLKYFSRFQQQNALFEKTLDLSQKENTLQWESQRMRLQCLGLVITISISGLSAGMLKPPLFFPGANPDNVLSLPHSHWRAVVDKLTISGTSEKTSVLLLPCDQEPCVARDYRGRMSLLDLVEMTLPGKSGTAERENRKVREVIQTRDQNGNIIYQWYDQDGHLHTISEWEFKRRLSMYFQSLLEFLYPEYFGSSIPAGGGWHQWQYWKVRRTADRPENTGQQRWPARQTRHQPNRQTARVVAAAQPVQQAGFTKKQPCHQNARPRPSSGKAIGRTVENEIDRLLMEFESGHMQSTAARHHKNYEGRKHGQYCCQIKNATRTRRKPLTNDEKLRFVPFMRHLSEVVYSFNGISLSVCVHSLVASQLLYPPRSTQGQRTALGGEGESVKKAQKTLIEQLARAVESRARLQERAPCGFDVQAISNLLWALAKLVENGLLQLDQGGLASQMVTALLPQVQSHQDSFTSQEVSNSLWALAKLVENGLLQPGQDGLASQVAALLLKVVTPPEPFTPQQISNLLWALAKLVENGRLQLGRGGLASQAVTALLLKIVTPPGPFIPQQISSLLWALAKLVENGLLQLDQGSLVSQTVTALLLKVVTPPGPFIPQEISNLLWALAKLVENGRLQMDRDDLVNQAVTALLPQVQSHQDDFTSQGVSNLVWALAKLVENGLLQLDQGGLASQAVTELLPQVQSHQDDFTSQGISNLLWALAKLVENGLLQLNQGGLSSQAVTALLSQVVTPPGPFKPQEISNLLWALAKLVENGQLKLDQGDLASQVMMALLPQVQSHQGDFTSQGISNLLWALAKLVEYELLQLDQGGLTSQAVAALLPRVVTPPRPFTPQGISNLLWALAALGDGVSLNEVFNILRTMDMNTIESWLGQEMTLWALTVFLARGGETSLLLPPMKKLYDALMAEKENSSDIRASIMRLSGIWLEENLQYLRCPVMTPLSPHLTGNYISS